MVPENHYTLISLEHVKVFITCSYLKLFEIAFSQPLVVRSEVEGWVQCMCSVRLCGDYYGTGVELQYVIYQYVSCVCAKLYTSMSMFGPV